MRACKDAHETITGLLPKERRKTITSEELKQSVLLYVSSNQDGRREMITQLALPSSSPAVEKPESHSLAELFELWKNGRIAEGFNNKKQLNGFNSRQRMFVDFFKAHDLKTTNDLTFHTAHDFMAWRSKIRYDKIKSVTSAGVVKKELDILRQMAKLAAMYGWIKNGNMWEGVKPKTQAGYNKKIVEPLSVEEQKAVLAELLERRESLHDIALFLLITGIRLGEMQAIKPDSIKNNIIALHGEHVGKMRTTGKTSSASRNLPVCPTIAKLFERGLIFKNSAHALQTVFKRHFKTEGVHVHRLRHTFAVNNLLAQKPLQMVSYQMGHAGTGITADLYGKFVPEHFKVGFEQAIAERKELLKWLEIDYFNCGGQND
jgi:integrase